MCSKVLGYRFRFHIRLVFRITLSRDVSSTPIFMLHCGQKVLSANLLEINCLEKMRSQDYSVSFYGGNVPSF